MNHYFRQIVQALDARIGRINNRVKRSLERAAENNTLAALLWAIVALYVGLAFWQSHQAWLEAIPKGADGVARLYRALLGHGTAFLDQVAKDPIGATVLAVIQHPLFLNFLGLLVVLRLVYLWLMEEGAATAHVRQIAVEQSLKLTGPERVHLFAHRIASVVILLLLVFPGSLILLADPLLFLLFSLVLVAIYGAIRLFGWVIAALFE